MTERAGWFVVLEGIDGSGSTTQGKDLARWLTEQGVEARFTCEPSEGPVGQLIRGILQGDPATPPDWHTLALLFAADRSDHVKRELTPELERGISVVSDRYLLSSLIYQSVTAARSDVRDWLFEINQAAIEPDLTIVLSVSAETALARRRARGGRAELFEVPDLQKQLARCYAEPRDFLQTERLVVIDGEEPRESVARAIQELVSERLLGAKR